MSIINAITYNNEKHDLGVSWDNVDGKPQTYPPGVHTHNVSDIEGLVIKDGVPAGVIMPYMGNGNIPNGYLLCNGQGVSKTAYPALFNAIGYTYGGSDDNFNLPTLAGRFLEGGDVAGEYKEAGLPNIEGKFIGKSSQGYAPSGAFYSTSDTKLPAYSGTDVNNTTVFDASRFNSIYGNSDTVQPKSIVVRYIIKY